jgi:hypothetical protein
MRKNTILVPIGESGESVEIDCLNLPKDVDHVLGILQAELAPLNVWLECAKAYLADDMEKNQGPRLKLNNIIRTISMDERSYYARGLPITRIWR